MERVVRPGGVALRVDVTPGWYGGHLQPIITGRPREPLPAEASQEAVLSGRGYAWFDVAMDQAYDSVEALVATYGFIHSKRVIDYARAHQVTSIRWTFRVRYKVMPPA
jgi:hypothetical protein